MPNDPSTLMHKGICGVWVYGLEDVRAPLVWAACARFVFCTNFKEGGGTKLPAFDNSSFLVVVIDQSHRTQFFSMRLNECQWSIASHSKSIDREQNLYFKPYLVPNVMKNMCSVK